MDIQVFAGKALRLYLQVSSFVCTICEDCKKETMHTPTKANCYLIATNINDFAIASLITFLFSSRGKFQLLSHWHNLLLCNWTIFHSLIFMFSLKVVNSATLHHFMKARGGGVCSKLEFAKTSPTLGHHLSRSSVCAAAPHHSISAVGKYTAITSCQSLSPPVCCPSILALVVFCPCWLLWPACYSTFK